MTTETLKKANGLNSRINAWEAYLDRLRRFQENNGMDAQCSFDERPVSVVIADYEHQLAKAQQELAAL